MLFKSLSKQQPLKSDLSRSSGNEGSRQTQILLAMNYIAYHQYSRNPLDFEFVGFNEYSATNEDGILLYILTLIGTSTRKCVDIGSGLVDGSNVANLIVNHGYDGLLIDGSLENVRQTSEFYLQHKLTRLRPPTSASAMVTAENINALLVEYGYGGEIDVLSIDIDGIDFWIWKAMSVIQPRVVVVEYQDILGPERSWTVPYDPEFRLRNFEVNAKYNNYCGASLQAFVKLGRCKGYRLVGCNWGGWNAFFVRNDLCQEYLPEVTAESCFRYAWNKFGMEERFPLVQDMEWVVV